MHFQTRHRMRTAKRLHVCFECLTCIQPGTKYSYLPVLQNGAWTDYKFCLRCSTLRRCVFWWRVKTVLLSGASPNDAADMLGQVMPFGELFYDVGEALNRGFNWPVPLAMPEQVAFRLAGNQELRCKPSLEI